MYEKGVLTIGDWQKGVNESPLYGHASIVGCDIFDTPGVLKISPATTLDFTPTGLLLSQVIGTDGATYSLYDDGKFYKDSTLLTTLSNANDLLSFRDYILFTHGAVNSYIGTYGPFSSPYLSTTTFALSSGSDVYFKKLLISEDKIFIGNGGYVAKIETNTWTTGTSTTPPTASPVLTALALPSNVYCSTLENIGNYLAVGTQQGRNHGDRFNYNYANIILWDRFSSTSQKIIQIKERGMNAMVSTGNLLYFSAGNKGNIYMSDTTEFKKIKRIPFSNKKAYSYAYVYPNAMTFSGTGTLLIGTSSTDYQSYYAHGLWELDQNDTPTKNNAGYALALKHVVSNGAMGKTKIFKIGCVTTFSLESITIGWQSGTTKGVDALGITPYKNFVAYAESELVSVGSMNNQKTFKTVEYRLFEPLVQGQQIRISYRKNTVDDYTPIYTATYTNTDNGAVSHQFPATMTDLETVQFKIELDAGTAPIYPNNVSFIQLMAY